jgi:flavin-dependent dehydrogenase
MQENYDLFVLGGGLSGLTAALQIINKNPEAKILVADKKDLPIKPGSGSVGESTVELASHYFANVLNLKEHLEKDHLPKLGLRYFLESFENHLIENRLEVGANRFSPTPSYQIDRATLETHIWNLLNSKNVECVSNTKIEFFKNTSDTFEIELICDKKIKRSIKSKWFIDASGRGSYLKKKFDLKIKSTHECSAAWWKVKGEIRIDDWCKDNTWTCRNGAHNARWFSTNHLMGEGYWVWIIPLSTDQTSFGIVADSEIHSFSQYNTVSKAIEWLQKHEPKAAEICKLNIEGINDFGCLKNYSYDCKKVFSDERWLLTGEAGVFIDPFYSPGSDFIAIANTYITDLISRSLKGEDVRQRTLIYNDIYLRLVKATNHTFRNQYPTMGNPLVMPIKVFWDWCFYWNFLARMFFDEKMCDLSFFSKMQEHMAKAERLNIETQEVLLKWNKFERPNTNKGFFNLADYPYLYELNAALSNSYLDEINSASKIEERFVKGISNLEKISNEIKTLFSSRNLNSKLEITEEKFSYIGSYYKDLSTFLYAAS